MASVFEEPNTVVLQAGTEWWHFRAPREVLCAERVSEAPALLRAAEAATARGLYAVGFLTYEASPAFDDAFVTRPAGPLPPAWFGLYEAPTVLHSLPTSDDPCTVSPWTPSQSAADYAAAIDHVKAYIAAGDTYQVNHTLRFDAQVAGSPWALFCSLCRAQRTGYAAYVHLGRHVLCSASPELFFRLDGTRIRCKPMKGTAPRGLTWAEDARLARGLHASAKDRAENVMIVDMIRNDLGRIAETGSVRVPRLFDVERFPTVLQMTSTVTARTRAPLAEVLGALFPCASITGAPKVRTMDIIAELEDRPRGIYTGAIGYLAPGREAQFNVAIRTVHLDTASGTAEYGAGGGIVWDSTAEREYEEAHVKARVLTAAPPVFRLLETLRWTPGRGYALLRGHLRRLRESARYFGIPLTLRAVAARLEAFAACLREPRRVRLLVDERGEIALEDAPLPAVASGVWRLAYDVAPIDPEDRFLYHKTTHRARYDAARATAPGADDVLLWNPRGEVTESTIANVVARVDGVLVTPPVSCGLLPGVLRDHLLRRGTLTEGVLTRDTLARAEALWLINSVRGWVRADIARA
jgi:para-aminobenzoate synthetase/4-amino-4-deoxychorismate lyase